MSITTVVPRTVQIICMSAICVFWSIFVLRFGSFRLETNVCQGQTIQNQGQNCMFSMGPTDGQS